MGIRSWRSLARYAVVAAVTVVALWFVVWRAGPEGVVAMRGFIILSLAVTLVLLFLVLDTVAEARAGLADKTAQGRRILGAGAALLSTLFSTGLWWAWMAMGGYMLVGSAWGGPPLSSVGAALLVYGGASASRMFLPPWGLK